MKNSAPGTKGEKPHGAEKAKANGRNACDHYAGNFPQITSLFRQFCVSDDRAVPASLIPLARAS
jgi:hypothetical protein